MTKFDLDEEGEIAADELKNNLFNPQILASKIEDAPFIFETNPCDKQVGHVLLQPQQNKKESSRTMVLVTDVDRGEEELCHHVAVL